MGRSCPHSVLHMRRARECGSLYPDSLLTRDYPRVHPQGLFSHLLAPLVSFPGMMNVMSSVQLLLLSAGEWWGPHYWGLNHRRGEWVWEDSAGMWGGDCSRSQPVLCAPRESSSSELVQPNISLSVLSHIGQWDIRTLLPCVPHLPMDDGSESSRLSIPSLKWLQILLILREPSRIQKSK